MVVLVALIVVLLVLGAALRIWHWSDERRVARVWQGLASRQHDSGDTFDPSSVADLPEPARRYFSFTIRPGAPIRTVSEIRMTGEIGLGTRGDPRFMSMRARQILAPPYGLVWELEAGHGLSRITGSDGCFGTASWTRFWLLKTIPVVRVGGSGDHARAAFGRVVAEAAFWAPAALLPGETVSWEPVSRDVARATVRDHGLVQSVDVTVAADGQPKMVVIQRWSNANPDKTYRLQPFGGYFGVFREFDGYRLPTRVEGGNFIGTDAYFPFYKAEVEELHFVESARAGS